MKIHLTDYCYDSVENQIRTKGRKELASSAVIFALCLFVLFLILAPFFELRWYFALLGLFPLVGLFRQFKTKVLFLKNGQVVKFFQTANFIELESKKKLLCEVIQENCDSYFVHIYYEDRLNRIKLIDSTDFISERDFNLLFGSIFEDLSYDFKRN